MSQSQQTAEILVEALPYIQRFDDALIVVKLGGAAMENETLFHQFAEDVLLLRSVGMRPVVVHGGGPQISAMSRRLGLEPVFQDGLRVTDAETLDVARMVLGRINKDIAAAINARAPVAVGLSGEDAGLMSALPAQPGLGRVGKVAQVRRTLIDLLTDARMIPVLSSVARGSGGQAFNINADEGASALAAALKARKLVYLTGSAGLLNNPDDPDSTISELTLAETETILAERTGLGGMRPKLQGCASAVRGGVAQAHIIDGRKPHALLVELMTDAGIGTMIKREVAVDEA